MSVTCTAVLEASEDTVLFAVRALARRARRRGTRGNTRVLGTYKQAVCGRGTVGGISAAAAVHGHDRLVFEAPHDGTAWLTSPTQPFDLRWPEV